jgi:hypothetical protein
MLVGGPTVDGGTAVVETNASGLSTPLPAGGWRATRNGYRYADRDGVNGPVRSVAISRNARGTFGIKIVMSGEDAPLSIVPPNPEPKRRSPSSSEAISRTAHTTATRPAGSSRTTDRDSFG